VDEGVAVHVLQEGGFLDVHDHLQVHVFAHVVLLVGHDLVEYETFPLFLAQWNVLVADHFRQHRLGQEFFCFAAVLHHVHLEVLVFGGVLDAVLETVVFVELTGGLDGLDGVVVVVGVVLVFFFEVVVFTLGPFAHTHAPQRLAFERLQREFVVGQILELDFVVQPLVLVLFLLLLQDVSTLLQGAVENAVVEKLAAFHGVHALEFGVFLLVRVAA